jgi:hypothetical protein
LLLSELDAIGIFGYSDEDGTQAAGLAGHLDPGEIRRRVDDLSDLADEVMAQRAAARVGETVEVLIEEHLGDGTYLGRAAHQAPEVDGATTVLSAVPLAVGDLVTATVTGSDGVDLLARGGAAPVAGAGAAPVAGAGAAPVAGAGAAPVAGAARGSATTARGSAGAARGSAGASQE